MTDLADVFADVAKRAADHGGAVAQTTVVSRAEVVAGVRAALGHRQDEPLAPALVVDRLVTAVEPALVASTGPRYFGYVIGGALPSATAADTLAAGRDQCAFNATASPGAAVVGEVVGEWFKDLLGLPPSASTGLVTGGQGAKTVALAAARHRVLADAGWDVERDGLARSYDAGSGAREARDAR